MTSLTKGDEEPPLFLSNAVRGNLKAEDWLEFVIDLVETGQLVAGSFARRAALSQHHSLAPLLLMPHPQPLLTPLPARSACPARPLPVCTGDYFVIDNCPIHCAESIFEHMLSLLTGAGVRLVFLPPYASDLNPCEFVFAWVKARLRRMRRHGAIGAGTSFLRLVAESFAVVPHEHMHSYYRNSMHPHYLR